jgi:hypothetical protein
MHAIPETYKTEFAKTMKIGLVATIDDQNDPHITILSTLMAKGDRQMMLGEFVGGLSKAHVRKKPKSGFLIMNLNKEFWTGTMCWTHCLSEGEDYVQYNMQPKYRYNTYFGIHTVHYFDLMKLEDKRLLDMRAIVFRAVEVLLLSPFYKGGNSDRVLKPWAHALLKKIDTLTFLSLVDPEGYPVIIPVIQAQAVNDHRIVLTSKPYADSLVGVPSGTRVAFFGLNLEMENVLVKGSFSGFRHGIGYVDIDRVYNSMPPKQGYIYPKASSPR